MKLPALFPTIATSFCASAFAQRILTSTFQWNSTGPLVGVKPDGRNLAGIKDPSVVFYNDRYHVFASTAHATNGYSLVYFSFTDFAQANTSTFHYLDQAPLGTGYRAAPQVFYFEQQKLWYLVYQNNNAAYSTNTDIANPLGWTAPKTFYPSVPATVTNNIGAGYWVDMWVICDWVNCHLFSSDDNGHLFRSQTTLQKFPNGFSEPVIAMSDPDRFKLFEASNVYYVDVTNYPVDLHLYILIVEAIGTDSRRYFRSWRANNIAGPWEALADTETHPFARANNVAFPPGVTPWTKDISHGEVVRTNPNQLMIINPCKMKYLYQGMDPNATGNYNSLPWKLALLTQTNSAC